MDPRLRQHLFTSTMRKLPLPRRHSTRLRVALVFLVLAILLLIAFVLLNIGPIV